MALKKIEIDFEGPSLKFRNVNTAKENVWEYFLARNIKSITTNYGVNFKTTQSDGSYTSTYPFIDKFEVRINFLDENNTTPLAFDIQSVSNQPTWTGDLTGLYKAVYDINSWIGSTVGDMSGISTEDTLQDVLAAIQAQKDRESVRDRFVANTDNGVNGYSVGDSLSRISYFDMSSGAAVLVDTFWFNHTTDVILGTVDLSEVDNVDNDALATPGVVGDTFTSPASPCIGVAMIFDADNVLVENNSNKDVLVSLGGILGNDYVVIKNSSKNVKIDVPHINSIQVCGVGGSAWVGDVHVTYSRSK